MRINYQFKQLSNDEREYLEELLMEEIEVQAWYAVTYSCVLGEEVFIPVQ